MPAVHVAVSVPLYRPPRVCHRPIGRTSEFDRRPAMNVEEVLGRVSRAEGSGEQPTLAVVGAKLKETVALRRCLYAFRDRRQRKRLRHRQYGANDYVVFTAIAQPGDEGTIDLHLIEGKHAQVSQRGVASAEIVGR
jgi:hypothetical protein